ncbi:MAG: helix-turn-helix domain-containing protein [Betaproteobacteria bacterium]
MRGICLNLAKAMMADKSLSVGDIAKTMGVSRSTLYRI